MRPVVRAPDRPCAAAALDRPVVTQYNLVSGTDDGGYDGVHGKFDDLGRFADPSVLILTSLSGGPKHGYAIMTDVAAFSGVRMEPGTLYGALSRLERRGWIRRWLPPSAAARTRSPRPGRRSWPGRSRRCSRSCRSPGCAPPPRGARDAARAGRPDVPCPGRLAPAALAAALRRGDARRPGPAPPDRADRGQPGSQRRQRAPGPGLAHGSALAAPAAPGRPDRGRGSGPARAAPGPGRLRDLAGQPLASGRR